MHASRGADVVEPIRTPVLAMRDSKVAVIIGGTALGRDRRGALPKAGSARYAAKSAARNRPFAREAQIANE